MEWAKQVRGRLNNINTQDSLRVAARTVLPMMRTRIFDNGKTPSGADIGTYSRTPLYIALEEMSKTSVGRSTRGGKSKYFPGGYAQYKSALGAKGFNLRNFGVMMRDFLTPLEIADGTRLVFRFKEQRNEDISNKYPQAFGFSPDERQRFNRIFTAELTKRIFRD